MTSFSTRAIAVLEVYGGITGAWATLSELFTGVHSVFWFVCAPFAIGLYCVSVCAGVWLLEGGARGVSTSRWVQWLQVPFVVTPVVSYTFASGASVLVYLGAATGWKFAINSDWAFVLGGGGGALGVNFVPVAALFLLRGRASERPRLGDNLQTAA